MLWAAVVTLMSAALGEFWYLFVAFFIAEVIDYLTGWYKARVTKTENSNKGLKGIVKKLGYWIVIGIAFFMSLAFTDMGTQLGIDLSWTPLVGWFTLATFIINEIRSILENLIIIGVDGIPKWLIKGLEVAAKAIDDKNGGVDYGN